MLTGIGERAGALLKSFAAGVAAVALAAVIGLPVSASAQERSVKLGAVLPLSGPLASSGREVRDGIDLAVEEINARGGIKSLGGAKLVIAYGDSQAKPDVANSETERLINSEQVLAVMDMYPSVTSLAASQAAERLKTPFYVGVSAADSITERGFRYVFQQLLKASDIARFEVEFLNALNAAGGSKINRVAVIHEDGDYGQVVEASLGRLLKDSKYNVVATFSYPFRTTNVSTMLSRVKAANPDVVIQVSYIGDAILIARTAAQLEIKAPFIDSGGKAHQSYIEATGKLSEGEYILALWNDDVPGGKDLDKRYRDKTGKSMPSHAALLYQAVLTLSAALEKASKADREALRDALATIDIGPGPNLVLPYDRIKFNDKGLIVGGGYLMTRVTKGAFATVFPPKYASQKLP